MKEEKKEKRSKESVIYDIISIIIFLIGVILGGRFIYNMIWPDTYTEVEVKYYKEIAEKAWNEGLDSVKEECSSDFFTDPVISFEDIDRNKIIVKSTKKGSLTFDFSNPNITVEYDTDRSIIEYVLLAIMIFICSVMLGVFAVLFIFVLFDLIVQTVLKNIKNYHCKNKSES